MDKQTAFWKYLAFNGADLFTLIYLPASSGKFPTVLYRAPYVDDDEFASEEAVCEKYFLEFKAWIDGGYAVAFQHCRGRGKSTGDCIPYINEREDGLFFQDWVRKQPFYNGELYLCGGSYTSSVHFVTAPFADDIKGAILQIQDTERYNCNYRNGFFKIGLHGGWYVDMYKKKSIRQKNYTAESYNLLPLSSFSKTVFGEPAADFDAILQHPDKDDAFWDTRFGGGEARNAVTHANIPVLLVTGFYDIYTGGIFDMWNKLDPQTKAQSALAVHPFDHGGNGDGQPIRFENGDIATAFKDYPVRWADSVRGCGESPFERGKVTYYKLFADTWCCDDFAQADHRAVFSLGDGTVSYRYDPNDPAVFPGGLSANFDGSAWQDEPNKRSDIITVYTPVFQEDTFVKGKIEAKMKVRSDCEDTCFYMRLSLCKNEGDYGLRDDINQISNFCSDYIPGTEIEMAFSFDEHAFVIKKGEKIRIDISSSAFPHYVRHTNNKGLFSEQTSVKTATNTVNLGESYICIPIEK